MALYQIIQELEHLDYFPDLVNKGIIPSTFIDYKVIYEYYLGLINGHYDGAREERASKRLAKQIQLLNSI